MIERLCNLRTMDEMTAFGLQMLSEGPSGGLQQAMRKECVIFSPVDYWSEDTVWQITANPKEYEAALAESLGDTSVPCVLHRLQLLQASCPAVATMVAHLLKKTTC